MSLSELGALATALAVFIAGWQLYRGTVQARTDFEDDLTREYREIARAIPVDLHLGGTVHDADWAEVFSRMFQYIDLTNEQVFLRQANRVGAVAWEQWRDGIQATLAQPAFARAWAEVKERAPGRFTELRRLEFEGFNTDPRHWAQ